MRIAVFGATGKTGIEVVKQGLDRGDSVVTFVRNPSKMTLQNANLTLVPGDVFDLNAVEKAIQGTDAVIVALGAGPDTKGAVNTDGTKNIVAAMKKYGVKRLVVESSYPMSGSPESMEFLKAMVGEDKIANMQPFIDDKAGQEKVTQESGLDWIIVRPLSLTDGPKTGKYRASDNLEVKPGDNISRADVADFMLKHLETAGWVGKIVTISSSNE